MTPAGPRSPIVLAVDDSPAVLESVCAMLSGEAEVLFATTGDEALTLAGITVPDLILLDIVMPGPDGFETCRRLKADPVLAEIPVVFLTGLQESADTARGLELGALDFLAKPFDPAILRTKVHNLLAFKAGQDRLKGLSRQDALTGIANRRAFDETLAMEWERAQRGGHALALVMVDVDHFKAYNDHLGHPEGDRCLQAVAGALEAALPRKVDTIARYGGEEFAAILPYTDQAGAERVAETLRMAVQDLTFPHPASPVGPSVTISLGAVALTPGRGQSPEQLTAAADKALYRAKHAGRNRWEGPEPPPAQAPPAPAGPRKPGFLLLVDDDVRMRNMMAARLEFLGLPVVVESEPFAALKTLGGQLPDLILSDVVMPLMDGFDFCRRCKGEERLREIPFVFLTAVSNDLQGRAMAAGGDDCLSKLEPEHVFRMRVRTNLELGLIQAPPVPAEGGSLLIVSPSSSLRGVVARQAAACGIQAQEITSLLKAPEALRTGRADVLVLDAALLGDLPPAWFEDLHDQLGGQELPILALATPQEDALLADLESQCQDRVAKPLVARELRHRLNLLLRLSQGRKRLAPVG